MDDDEKTLRPTHVILVNPGKVLLANVVARIVQDNQRAIESEQLKQDDLDRQIWDLLPLR